MQDRVDEIISRAIVYTQDILNGEFGDWAAAKAGLERMQDNLALDAPDHPAFERLSRFIAEQDRRQDGEAVRR
jgi:hypothetical protein